jgi:DNA-binding response OmpR family regulator
MSPLVLLVESDTDLRSAISSALTRAEYDCDAVATPAAAVLKLREHDYAYVIVDDHSLELQHALHAQRGKVIFITDEDEIDALRKPFGNEELLAHLR